MYYCYACKNAIKTTVCKWSIGGENTMFYRSKKKKDDLLSLYPIGFKHFIPVYNWWFATVLAVVQTTTVTEWTIIKLLFCIRTPPSDWVCALTWIEQKEPYILRQSRKQNSTSTGIQTTEMEQSTAGGYLSVLGHSTTLDDALSHDTSDVTAAWHCIVLAQY